MLGFTSRNLTRLLQLNEMKRQHKADIWRYKQERSYRRSARSYRSPVGAVSDTMKLHFQLHILKAGVHHDWASMPPSVEMWLVFCVNSLMWYSARSMCWFSPSSCLLAGLTYIALRGKPGSPGMGKLVMPRVYISFSPWLLELHCNDTIQRLRAPLLALAFKQLIPSHRVWTKTIHILLLVSWLSKNHLVTIRR